MVQKQRSYQVFLIERFQKFNGIQNPLFIGAGQFLNESFDCRQIRHRLGDFRRLDQTGIDTVAECFPIFASGSESYEDPDTCYDNACKTEPLPGEFQSPRLDEE